MLNLCILYIFIHTRTQHTCVYIQTTEIMKIKIILIIIVSNMHNNIHNYIYIYSYWLYSYTVNTNVDGKVTYIHISQPSITHPILTFYLPQKVKPLDLVSRQSTTWFPRLCGNWTMSPRANASCSSETSEWDWLKLTLCFGQTIEIARVYEPFDTPYYPIILGISVLSVNNQD